MTAASHKWDKLSPSEFQQLQELAEYSNRKLQDVLQDFCGPYASPRFNPDGDIDYDGFRRFLDAFFDCETPADLAKHLFVSFLKPNATQSQLHGKALNQMAAISSTAACAPVTSHTKGSFPNINSIVEITTPSLPLQNETPRNTFVEKIHGITDKLHSLSGHLTQHDPSKTGSVHPMVTVTPSPLAAGPSIFQASSVARRSIDSSPSHSQTNHSQMSRNSSKKSNNSVNCKIDVDIKLLTRKLSHFDPLALKVPLKDVVCYLSLLEAGRPEDKLEFMFRLYDTDSNGVLDTSEMDAIVNQMMAVAEYLGWDVSSFRPILQEMMIEIDYDADGTVSLEEWQRGGLTTIPLLVLLGVDNTALEDGVHVWKLKHFKKPQHCNMCLTMLMGLGKKGLCCVLCKYTVHERCVQNVPPSCITTYVKSRKGGGVELLHHWVEGNCYSRCAKCRKLIKPYHSLTGLTCRWCHMTYHNRCASSVKKECTLGEYADLIVSPTAICPAVLDRQRSVNQANKATHFQITPPNDTFCPLLVFINPKSGGRQGDQILRKFQYMLNPRQVYDLSKGGPKEGLTLFKDLPNFKVICCGGDGTVGWVLEAMDSIEMTTQPAIGVIPLGTGNDLARCLRWGGGYEGENIPKLMDKIKRSSIVMLDRWSIEVINMPPMKEIPRPKVTLHSNMQKVIELSQSVIVEKAIFEDLNHSTSVNTNVYSSNEKRNDNSEEAATAPASTSLISSTRMTTSSAIEYGKVLSSNNDGTKNISMSTSPFDTNRIKQILTAVSSNTSSSSSSSNCSRASTIVQPQQQEQQQEKEKENEKEKEEDVSESELETTIIESPSLTCTATRNGEKVEEECMKHNCSNNYNTNNNNNYNHNDIMNVDEHKPVAVEFQSLNLANNVDNDMAAAHAVISTAAAAATASSVATTPTIATTCYHPLMSPPLTDKANIENNVMASTETKTATEMEMEVEMEMETETEAATNGIDETEATTTINITTTNRNNNNNNNSSSNRNTNISTFETNTATNTSPTSRATSNTPPPTDAASAPAAAPQPFTTKLVHIPAQKQLQPPIKVQSEKVPYNIINNYFSVGVDAAICVKFHLEREKNPHKFNSRMKNKLWYFEYATSETFAASCKNLHENIEIVCDGVSLDLANGPHLQGVALLNIPYTHGGSNLWGEHLSQKRIRKSAGLFGKGKKLNTSDKELSATSFNSVDLSVATQDFGDRLIEVIGLENCLHMGQVRTGLRASGRRLAQCSDVIIKTKKTFPMQIDGEPWMQIPCTIKVSHKNQVPMLMAARSEGRKGLHRVLCC